MKSPYFSSNAALHTWGVNKAHRQVCVYRTECVIGRKGRCVCLPHRVWVITCEQRGPRCLWGVYFFRGLGGSTDWEGDINHIWSVFVHWRLFTCICPPSLAFCLLTYYFLEFSPLTLLAFVHWHFVHWHFVHWYFIYRHLSTEILFCPLAFCSLAFVHFACTKRTICQFCLFCTLC